jgi:FMN reductase
MTVAVVVGNPKFRSRTWAAARRLADLLTDAEPDVVIDLVDLGPSLLNPADPDLEEAVRAVTQADLVIVASPTYKGSYTGMLKVFLDALPSGALRGVTAVPLMLGAQWRHGMAADLLLKPVLVELGASCPTAGLFVLDTEGVDSPTGTAWLELARDQVRLVTATTR